TTVERPGVLRSAGHLGAAVHGTDGLGSQRAVTDRGERRVRRGNHAAGSRGLVASLSERIDAVEDLVAATIPEQLTEEREAVHEGRRIARRRPALTEEGRRRQAHWATAIGRDSRIGIDTAERGSGQALGSHPIVVVDIDRVEVLTCGGHATAPEDIVGTGIEGVERAVIGAAIEMTRRARRLPVAADLNI